MTLTSPRRLLKRHKRRKAVVAAVLAAATAAYEVSWIHRNPIPYHTSILTGDAWRQELFGTRNPHRFRDQMGMNKHVFEALVSKLSELTFLESGKFVSVHEKLAIFLYTVVRNLSNRKVHERFQHSGSTISK